ncbi:hypothetical protein DMB90_05255 [Raoultella planticola]|uniref:Uncharacterized protein n=1 Tax=Raoultella planticola TaxID=575 RepID=A0A5P6A9K0_RAOPL|nr:hypothetical protein DMB90_05255 [Raoultella planticola]
MALRLSGLQSFHSASTPSNVAKSKTRPWPGFVCGFVTPANRAPPGKYLMALRFQACKDDHILS